METIDNKETIQDKVDKKVKKALDNKIRPWLWSVGLVLLVTPFALTQKWITIIDFSGTGEVGDTIGGTLGPLVALIGAVLVYISFREQYKANISQWEALEDEKRIRAEDYKEQKRKNNERIVWDIVNDELKRVRELTAMVQYSKKESIESQTTSVTIRLDLEYLDGSLDIIATLLDEYQSSASFRDVIITRLEIIDSQYDLQKKLVEPSNEKRVNTLLSTIEMKTNKLKRFKKVN